MPKALFDARSIKTNVPPTPTLNKLFSDPGEKHQTDRSSQFSVAGQEEGGYSLGMVPSMETWTAFWGMGTWTLVLGGQGYSDWSILDASQISKLHKEYLFFFFSIKVLLIYNLCSGFT